MDHPNKRIKTGHGECMPDVKMDSPTQCLASPLAEIGSSSEDEDSSSLRSHRTLDDTSNETPAYEDAAPVTSVCVDTPVQETTSTNSINDEAVIHARAYQVEMFEKSLKENIIVTMDTGSGKTQVAVLRIQAELQKCSDKIIWFLAPTVALCEQQFKVIGSQIGAFPIKMLNGADNIDAWFDKRIWSDYLSNVRVVVSTYQILSDAITHAFVQISQLCLIVFDEAHHCIGKHPGCKIMALYRINKDNGMPCPAILGLTASPIVKSNPDNIKKIERNLDAICKAPTIHREELLSFVKRPVLTSITIPGSDIPRHSANMISFIEAFRSLQSVNIFEDPYVLNLRNQNNERSSSKLQKVLTKRDTPVIRQMQSTYRKTTEIHHELGSWASNYFIYEAITRFLKSFDQDLAWLNKWEATEKQYFANILRRIEIKPPEPLQNAPASDLSNKFAALVRELQSTPDGTRCIIFVLETTTVAVLAHMLTNTASVSERFRVGTMIGTSNYMGKKRDLGDLNEVKSTVSLEDFRMGKLNLLVATSVAEEGLDIPACNLVVCFNAPPNVKSFIQRRGRARMENSRIIILSEESSDQHKTWAALEDTMKRLYEDNDRVACELAEFEKLDNDTHIQPLRIPSTGSQLDLDQAKSHLEFFCQKITSGQYIEHRPYFIAEENNDLPDGVPKISAVVRLPPSVHKSLRQISGIRRWYSERNAFKDAAFQAYKALYEAGLVNDHLMPLTDDILEGVETRSSIKEVNGPWNPWYKVAQLWGQENERTRRGLLLKDGDRVMARFEASLPCHFPELPSFDIFWDPDTTWTVELSKQSSHVEANALEEDQSAALIHLAYGHRWTVENSPHVLHLQSTEDIAFREHVGQQDVEKGCLNHGSVVRTTGGIPHLFIGWLPSEPPRELVERVEKQLQEVIPEVPWLVLRKWPKREDFLHPATRSSKQKGRYPPAFPVSHCTVDTIDSSKAYFGNIIPAIVHMIEVHLIAQELCHTVLERVDFSDTTLVATAISSRAAGERTDYERLEFLGDSVLKLLATVSVMIKWPQYPEGYLSAMKDRIVSNSRLCRASTDNGLDKFILTNKFTGKKWRPLYIKDFQSNDESPTRRDLSTKTLADVVESLIGAAYVDGGMKKALTCLGVLLPEVQWFSLTDAYGIISNEREIMTRPPPGYEKVEELVGYTFQNKALLMEALTHASWGVNSSTDACMERLEFLGDSILDSVIVSVLWGQEPELTNNQMHLARTASVNADLLGFLAMEWYTLQEDTEISKIDLSTIVTQKLVPFWRYMRHGAPEVVRDQQLAEQRHHAERQGILDAIAHGAEYPWAQLAHLNLPKFFSDMVESLIGAAWVDSGSMEVCKEIVERIGILPYLRRLLKDKVNIRHPKNKLGELAGRERKKVRYETEVRVDAGVKDLFCRIFIDEKLILEVGGGVTPEEVMTKAADEAYHMLMARGNDIEDTATTETIM
ncbi:dicer-like protein 2 [Xylaria bambusicola]|uniref:dicer-like protein 2 n=1 Tax=Xylaria bambusicola TaxID=326684 RepID=UPI002007E3BF|nr:dicer-like protein 2 [Xylaria bambusicola]KAI0506601.1 dicer-like protein 2 [Xylaria bambusicola]